MAKTASPTVATAPRERRPTTEVPPVPSIAAVKIWAAFGAVCVVVSAFVWGRWVLSGPQRTPPGPSTIPDWMRLSLNIQLVAGLVVFPFLIYFFLIRPWRRAGHLTLDGMITIGFLQMYCWDTYFNLYRPWQLYNSRMFNLGSWNNLLPGWTYPHGERIAEPFLFLPPAYLLFLGVAILGTGVMRRCKARWTGLRNWQLLAIAFAFGAIGDGVLETIWLRSGAYVFASYPGPKWATLFEGHYYQYPLIEPVLIGLVLGAVSALRYYRNDNGETVVERGVDQLGLSPRKQTRLRLLAIVGAVNAIYIGTFQLPSTALSFHAGPWAEDIVKRSYFTNMICGPGTDYACPGPDVPVPIKDSPHVNNEGKLVGR